MAADVATIAAVVMSDPRDPSSEAMQVAADSALKDEAARYVRGRRAAVMSIAVNTLLAAGKFFLATLTGSVALLADAVHTASDMLTSIVVWVGLRVGRRPADREHPYGHGRAETIAALVVAVLLGMAGLNLAWESLSRVLEPREVGTGLSGAALLAVAAIVLGTALVKAWLGRYAWRVGRAIENRSLITDAWHHYSDALSSVLVVAALVLARWDVFGADAWLGLGVSLILLVTAWIHGRAAGSSLLGEQPDTALVLRIASEAGSVHGVRDVHDIEVHDYGRRRAVSLHVSLESGLALADAHEVASLVEHRLGGQLGVAAVVHAEPVDEQSPPAHLAEVRRAVQRLLIRHAGIVSFHAVTVQPEDHGLEVEFHVHVPPATPVASAHELEHDVTETLVREFPGLHVHVHIEPCRLACDRCPQTCGVDSSSPT
jgi:cation diffusion facilitator family transporter